MRRQRSLFASVFALVLSTAGVFGLLGSANAATTRQLLPPTQSVCPPGTIPLTGPYKGLCKTLDGVIFNPITKEILSSPRPTLPIRPPSLPSTQPQQPSGGGPPNPGSSSGTVTAPKGNPTVASVRPTHMISASIASKHSYGAPYGMYFGNFVPSGQRYFSPSGLYETYRKVYYLSAFGRPLNSDVSRAVMDASNVAPVSTRVPHAPDEVWLLLPFGLVLLTFVTYLVLEPDSDRVFA